MIVGIIALFSGIVERKGFYIASLVISFLDAMLSGGVFGFLIYLVSRNFQKESSMIFYQLSSYR